MAAPVQAANLHGSLWFPFKELYSIVCTAVYKRDTDVLPDLDAALRKHKADFVALLRNPSKNAESQAIVKKGSTDGIPLIGHQMPYITTSQMVEEALIISDMFNLNELSALELILVGESQLPQYPGMTRGLIAVLLYYDGRRSIVNALRTLIQAREGHTWTLGLSTELLALATKYTDQLIEEGLLKKILDLLLEMDFAKEIDKLQKNRALGNPRHRKQVVDLIIEIKQTLAECLYCWTCQTPFNLEHSMQLLNFLMYQTPTSADGSVDNVTLAVLMSVLYAIDTSYLEEVENNENFIQRLPFFSDPNFVPSVHKELMSSQQWACPGLKAIVQFAWAVTLRILSQQPNTQAFSQYFEEDEMTIDQAVENDVFFFLYNNVLSNKAFFQEEFYVKRIHNLITSFIIQMPLKVKELRNRGDETARIILAHQQEGLEPPVNLPRYFEHMMIMISKLYSNDPHNLELITDYWCPSDLPAGVSSMYTSRPPQRQVNLYKFVRLAGDLLPPSLYIPYIKMLTSLSNTSSCAHNCYNLLKLNGSNSGTHCSTVSWDHFFSSMNRYYVSLRQEIPLSSDTQHIYRHRPFMRGITPAELDGLSVVLELIHTVVDQDELARVAMCENQQWLPLVIILGLVSCSIPPALKAELLLTLVSFAKTPSIAANLWHSLEIAQIVQTVKSISSYQSGGIQVELDEIEARNEEYPMTCAFLKLINVLVDIPVPPMLGAGSRSPGFDPYLEFIRDHVFLKFNTRAYKNAGEKWKVAGEALSIFYKLLVHYEVTPEDFTHQKVDLMEGGSTAASKNPGHNIMIHMLHEGGMLKMILFIVDEAVNLLDQYTNFPGKESLESSSLLCLKLIYCVLTKQTAFLDTLRETGSPLFVSTMDKLLRGINARSGFPDYIVRIAKFVTFNSFLPTHALYVVKILSFMCQSPIVQPHLITMFTLDEHETKLLLNGFVEILESDEYENQDKITNSKEDETCGQINSTTQQDIIQLLLVCLPQPAPNLAHLLLGFELRQPVDRTVLQEPGVIGSPRTCLHSILSFLLRGADSRSGPSAIHDAPALAELGFHLIYMLCLLPETSGPTLRYLRSTYDFLYRLLQNLPFKTRDAGNISHATLLLAQQAWLMKTIAIELRVTAINQQRSHVQRLVNLLIEDSPDKINPGFLPLMEGEVSVIDSSFANISQLKPSNAVTGSLVQKKLLNILDFLNFSQPAMEIPHLEHFDPTAVEQVINSCEQRQVNGPTTVNVYQLHQLFQNEVNDMQGAAALGQRPSIIQEIQNILTYVVKRNKMKENIYAKRQAFDAWRQVTEVILTATPSDLLASEKRQMLMLELSQELLQKVLDPNSIPELSGMVAGVVLTLLANLRQGFLVQQPIEAGDCGFLPSLHVSISSSNLAKSPLLGQGLHSSSHQVILKGLIECIMKSGVGPQRVRANYYAALLNFLNIAKKSKEIASITDDLDRHSYESHILDKELEHEKLMKENLDVILSYGEHFMEVVCRDICNGHDIGRMLSMAALDVILSMDRHQHWLAFLTSQGYLRHLVESISQDDSNLQNVVTFTADSLKTLYVYESKMALLIRLASTAAGANNLLDCGIMNFLAECKVFSMRPEQDTINGVDSTSIPMDDGTHSSEVFVASPMACYRQILFPTLRLCLAIMASLGRDNVNATTKIMQFVIAHSDTFGTILRESHAHLTLPILQELSLVTQIVAKASLPNELDTDMGVILEVKGHVRRLQRLMLALLHRYGLNDAMRNHLSFHLPSGLIQNEATLAILQILSAVLNYCHSLISKPGEANSYPVLFLPNLNETIRRDALRTKDFQVAVTRAQSPNLGIVVSLMQQCTQYFMDAFDSQKNCTMKLQKFPELCVDELKELVHNKTGMEKLTGQARKHTLHQHLIALATYKSQEVKYYANIIENLLLILWRHLEYYLIESTPVDQGAKELSRQAADMVNQDFTDTLSNDFVLTPEEMKKFKNDVLSCVNEVLFKKLQEISQIYTKHHSYCSFLEALVRRLKHIVRLHIK